MGARLLRGWVLFAVLSLGSPVTAADLSWSRLTAAWPDPASLGDIPGTAVSWPSRSPFTPEDIGAGPEGGPPTAARGRLYLPPGEHAARSVPAVVLLHG